MSGLTIHGAHGSDVWVDVNDELVCLDSADLRMMRVAVEMGGTVERACATFDEADVVALTAALNGPQLDDCADCEGPGLVEVQGRLVCPGHAAGYGQAEDESMEAAS